MKKFKYRLQAVLKLKEHIEQERQKEHAEALFQLNSQRDKLSDMDIKKKDVIEDQTKIMKGVLNVAEILVYGRYLMRLKADKIGEIQLEQALHKTESKKRAKLLVATKEKKIQEKLKENLNNRFNEEFKMFENKEMDEIAINSFRRKSK